MSSKPDLDQLTEQLSEVSQQLEAVTHRMEEFEQMLEKNGMRLPQMHSSSPEEKAGRFEFHPEAGP